MASLRGTIRIVSSFASHSLMHFHSEAVPVSKQQTAVLHDDNNENLQGLLRQIVRRSYFSGTLLVLLSLLFLTTSRVKAQSTFGSIRGIAQDQSGAAISDVQVTLHNVDENVDRVTKTDAAGAYAFDNVLANKYSIRAKRDGFAETVLDGVTLAARQELRYTLTLTIATQASTVEVTSDAAQINTENGVIGDSKDTGDIGKLPLNFRASTTSPLAALGTSPNVQADSQGNIAIGGATANQIGFSVDGISTANVFNSAAGINPYPSPEGIAELKVTAFNNNAEFSQVGDVTFTTRGGTNSYHGTLFEYLQNDALDARVFSFTQKAPKHFNTFGGSFGGPVSIPHLYDGHNKTFFFVDYEGNRRRTSQAEQYFVPTLQERNGDLSGLVSTFPTMPNPAYDPNNPTSKPTIPLPLKNPFTGGIYANNVIPQASISPFATKLLNTYYPLPNLTTGSGAVNYQTLVPIPSNTDGFDARIDQVINSKQQVYARFNRKNLTVNVVNPLLPNDVDTEHDRSFLISHNYVINAHMLNEFRYGFTDTILAPNFGIEGAAALQGLGVQLGGDQGVNVSNHPTDQGFPTIVFNDGTNFTAIGRDHVGPTQSTTKQIADNFTYTKGRHTIRGGVDVRWVRFAVPEIETPSDDYGLFTFNQNTFTNSSFGDLLLGAPHTTYFAVTGPRDDAGGAQTGLYGQDQWQVNDRLTLSFGLRWELLPPFVDKNGIQANFDPNYTGAGSNGQGAIVINNRLLHGLGPAPAFLASFNACGFNLPTDPRTCTPVITNDQDGLPAGLRQTYRRNFDPRVSLAYRPFNDNKTVFRAGFGIFTVTALGQLQNNNESNPQAVVNTYLNNPNGQNTAPAFTFPQVTPPPPPGGGSGLAFGGGELEQATNPRYRDAQTAQWNVTVEREITSNTSVRASYVGMNSYRLPVTENLNQLHPSTTNPNPEALPFPNWSVIFSTNNLGGQNYQALELAATHRMARGLSYDANYSWAHNISDAQGDAPTAFQGETRYGLADLNRFDISANRGNVVGTRRQRLLVTGTYELPFGKSRQWLNSSSPVVDGFLGGWNVNTITLLETGPYLTPTDSVSNDQTNTNPAGDGSIVRPDRVGNPTPADRSASNYFNFNAFAHTPLNAGRVGNAGVGTLEAPGTIAVSAGLAKLIAIRESWRLRFESTFTNVLNRTNYAPPATNISNPGSFGVLTSAQTAENAGNRTGQVALRLEF
jgi:hypothetical protein